MKLVALAALFSVSVPFSAAAQNPSRAPRAAQPAQATSDKVAEAYAQFLLGHRFEDDDNFDSAVAAYKRAAALDPTAADITAQLAGLYLRQNKIQEAMSTAEQALKIAPANSEANRVLGVIYAALSEAGRDNAPRGRASDSPDENVTKAVRYLEAAIAHPEGQADPNVRATLSRLYVKSGQFAKAIPLLTDLVNQEPGWGDGPMLLAEAYAGAGRASDAIKWLEGQQDPRLLPTLADFYERDRRWKDAADTYARALQGSPRNAGELKTRYATALMNTGNRADLGKARDVLTEVVSGRSADAVAGRALVPLVAGAAASRRLQGGGGVGPPRHRPEQPEPVGLLCARRSARRAASVPGRRRRTGPVRQSEQGLRCADRRRAAAAASGVRVSGTGAARQVDRRVRRGAPDLAEGSVGGRLSDRGEYRRQE